MAAEALEETAEEAEDICEDRDAETEETAAEAEEMAAEAEDATDDALALALLRGALMLTLTVVVAEAVDAVAESEAAAEALYESSLRLGFEMPNWVLSVGKYQYMRRSQEMEHPIHWY